MDFSFFDPVIEVFGFIGSLISQIIDAISGLTNIVVSLVELIINITRILPYPMYPCLLAFLSVYSTIFIYKIIRKG